MSKPHVLTSSSLAALFFLLATAPADAAVGQASQQAVQFDAIGPAGMKITGTSSSLSVSEENANVKVVVPLATLVTGISLRDKHMREKYLETDKYPNAILTVARSALKFPGGGSSSGDVDGTMTIHGVTKPVRVHYDAKSSGDSIDITGTSHVNMNDYGISVPSYLGVTVKPDVALTVKFRAKDA